MKSRAGANNGKPVGRDAGFERHYRCDHLNFHEKVFGEQGTNGAVDKPACEHFAIGRPGFTLNVSARDAARGVELFDVIDAQREKILSGFGFFGGGCGHQNLGVATRNEHGTVGLARNAASFDGDLFTINLEGLFNNIEHRDPNYRRDSAERVVSVELVPPGQSGSPNTPCAGLVQNIIATR